MGSEELFDHHEDKSCRIGRVSSCYIEFTSQTDHCVCRFW